MRILFAITALCLLVLLWAGLAIRRHIRAAARERAERQRPSAKAIIERELKQELRTAQAEKGFFGSLSDPQPSRHSISKTRQAVRDSAIRVAAAMPTPAPEPVQRVEAPQPEPVAVAEPQAVEQHIAEPHEEFRKPPVSISGTKFERLDLGQFKNDLGDLSDPYQIPRTARNRS